MCFFSSILQKSHIFAALKFIVRHDDAGLWSAFFVATTKKNNLTRRAW